MRSTLILTEREYLWSWAQMLSNNLKISHTTKKEFFELKFFQIDERIWQSYCRVDLSSVSDTLTCWLSISVLTWSFLGIWVTTLFAFYNFGSESAMRLILFFKLLKIWFSCQKWRKTLRKYFAFWRKLHLNWFVQTLSFSERVYLSSGVNTLTNSLEISCTTKKKFFEQTLFHSHQKIWQIYCPVDLDSVLDPLTCCLSISVLTRRFLGI